MFYGIFMAKIVRINKKRPSKGLFSLLFWCARLDLNQHARRHMLLRHTCIPISPLAHGATKYKSYKTNSTRKASKHQYVLKKRTKYGIIDKSYVMTMEGGYELWQ